MNLSKRTILVVLSLCAMAFTGFAQSVKITGTVVDAQSQPVIGAGVKQAGTSNGVVTDFDGTFTISVPAGSVLEVSALGYDSQSVSVVSGKDTYTVVLAESAFELDDVVVVGYGTQRKKLITGSTVSVSSEKIAGINAVDALGALQSQAAGVNITANSGQPGESYKVTIRGMGTIGDANPLYVIDGVPGGSITDLSPNDIESIDVLKDAASSAIYGARASNGVILVTTKQGKSGKVQVGYSGYIGFQNPNTNGVTPLGAKDYMEINTKAYEIQGTTPYDFQSLIPKQYAQIMNGTWDGTNWLEETTNHNAPITNQSVTINGGSDISRFALGFTYFNQEGTIGYPATPEYTRYTVRLNSDYSILKKHGRDIVKFGENVTFSTTDKTGVNIGGIYDNNIRELLVATPLLPAYNEDGDFYILEDMVADGWDFDQNISNPLAKMYYRHNGKLNKNFRLQSNFFLEVSPIKSLKFKSSAGWNYYHGESRSYQPEYILSGNDSNPSDDVSQSQRYGSRWSWENTLNYVEDFGEHHFDILAGQSLEKWGMGSSVGAKNSFSLFPGSFEHAYITNTQGVDAANTEVSGSPNTQGALSSFFGRLNYNYKETYMFSAVLRVDGSSNFARGHRWGTFPSVSAGWVVSNEDFMDFSKDWLSFFKIRGSWGQNGNCNIDNFQYVATVAFNAPYYFSDRSVPQTGAYADILPNENVKWETSEQLDFGFDARFFKSRLGLTFDWYNKTTKDWLVVAPALLSYGTGAPYVNGGDIKNTGYEIFLSWNDAPSKDFNYGATLSLSHNRNEVTRLANSEGIIHGPEHAIAQNTTELYRVQVGYPIGYFWGYQMDGIVQNQADLEQYLKDNCGGDLANCLQGKSLQPGDVKFVDVNGDGKITVDDKTMIGDPNPDFNLGFSINVAYKGFDLAINGYGAFGQQVAKSYRQFSDHPDNNYCTDVFTKYWTGEGSTNRYPRFSDGKNVNMSEISRVWVEDADYLKVQNITLGYDFNRIFKWKNVGKIRAYVSAQNMLTFTKYSGMDPEVGFGNGASWASGIDNGYYPSSNAWIFGFNINF